MRVCIRLSDGKILEAQSNDRAPMDALIKNVIDVRGYGPDQVEFKIMAEADVYAAIEAQNLARIPKPVDKLQIVIDELASKPGAGQAVKDLATKGK